MRLRHREQGQNLLPIPTPSEVDLAFVAALIGDVATVSNCHRDLAERQVACARLQAALSHEVLERQRECWYVVAKTVGDYKSGRA